MERLLGFFSYLALALSINCPTSDLVNTFSYSLKYWSSQLPQLYQTVTVDVGTQYILKLGDYCKLFLDGRTLVFWSCLMQWRRLLYRSTANRLAGWRHILRWTVEAGPRAPSGAQSQGRRVCAATQWTSETVNQCVFNPGLLSGRLRPSYDQFNVLQGNKH
jgi:hypothetical protein